MIDSDAINAIWLDGHDMKGLSNLNELKMNGALISLTCILGQLASLWDLNDHQIFFSISQMLLRNVLWDFSYVQNDFSAEIVQSMLISPQCPVTVLVSK